jgi:hypothetical protein
MQIPPFVLVLAIFQKQKTGGVWILPVSSGGGGLLI